jgi:adenosylcobinamide-GDP ribazoletransferase
VAVGAEIAAALRIGSGLGPPRASDSPDALVAGLAWLPAVGLVIGLAAAQLTALVAPAGPPVASLTGAVTLAVLGGPWLRLGVWPALRTLVRPGDGEHPAATASMVVGVGLVVAMAVALAAMPAAARGVALLLAPTLGRWAMVVQCHGGRRAAACGPAAAIVGRATFREFGVASVTALGMALVVADALALAAALGAAGLTLGIRLVAHRRRGGLDGRLVAATGALVELEVLAVLAALT